ncbi:hypothetical protein ACTYEO_09355 [Rhodophyticola sp. SM2404]
MPEPFELVPVTDGQETDWAEAGNAKLIHIRQSHTKPKNRATGRHRYGG